MTGGETLAALAAAAAVIGLLVTLGRIIYQQAWKLSQHDTRLSALEDNAPAATKFSARLTRVETIVTMIAGKLGVAVPNMEPE